MKSEEYKGIKIVIPELRQLDLNNSSHFNEDLSGLLEGEMRVALNLENVNFMDSTGLGIIVSALRSMNDKSGKIALFGIRPAVKILFDMVRLTQIANIFDTRDQAVEYLLG